MISCYNFGLPKDRRGGGEFGPGGERNGRALGIPEGPRGEYPGGIEGAIPAGASAGRAPGGGRAWPSGANRAGPPVLGGGPPAAPPSGGKRPGIGGARTPGGGARTGEPSPGAASPLHVLPTSDGRLNAACV